MIQFAELIKRIKTQELPEDCKHKIKEKTVKRFITEDFTDFDSDPKSNSGSEDKSNSGSEDEFNYEVVLFFGNLKLIPISLPSWILYLSSSAFFLFLTSFSF